MSTDKNFIALNDGNRVPWLAFGIGTAHFNKDATTVVKLAIDSGVTHLDGAQMYNNEESIAQGVKASGKPRSELFIVTKLHKLAPGETVKDSLRVSLAKLGTDYVDLFLIHLPTPWDKEGTLGQVWKGMEEVKQEGLAKSIGVSNFKVEDLKQVLDGATIIPAVNQIEFHPYVYKSIQPIIALGAKHGITTASYGGLSPVVRVPDGPLSPVLETVRSRLEATRGKPVSVGQVLTKWIHQKGAIVVTTSSKEERIKQYLDTINVPNLTEDEIKLIDKTGAQLHKRMFLPHLFGE
ncbi:Aldo/keto reductase [Pleurotus eryngii]|uniref:Aldo/keto reductase n=1 Tax=Pleurotus eryngii TaxID=5323 RepID=A0A9P6DBI1_PLEER|nr:Aldo/keto reductase [Pleurotus eryngii]